MLELNSMIKDLLFAKGGEQEKPLLCFAKMNRSQLAENARQLEEKTFAEMQASNELDQRRKTHKRKEPTQTPALEEENKALKEQVRKLTEQVQLLMSSSQEHGAASSAENSAEWQTLAGRSQ